MNLREEIIWFIFGIKGLDSISYNELYRHLTKYLENTIKL